MEIREEHVPGSDERRVTITYSRADDDPAGTLGVLVLSGRLGHLLRQIGRYNEPDGIAADGAEFGKVMAAVRDAFFYLEYRRRVLLLAGHDQFGLSWSDLALGFDLARQTAARWATEERAAFAGRGQRYTPAGLLTAGGRDVPPDGPGRPR
jgi:hypothetical protein